MSVVLVAYATKNGSTREVAESIAATLREPVDNVDVLPAGQIRDSITGRDLVVLGAPIYSRRWDRDAHRFMFGRVDLARRRGGPRRDRRDWEAIRGWANSIAALASKSTPAPRA
jgi:menaquinone-dependent protoporphyrinogen oxidase